MPERSSRRNDGFTLVELTAVLAILTVLMYIAVPGMLSYIKKAEETAAFNEAQVAAEAVQRYLNDEKEAGRLTPGRLHRLMNVRLNDPSGPLKPYISTSSRNARVVSVDVDLAEGRLKSLTYENKKVRVKVTIEEDGTKKVEDAGSDSP